MTEDVRELAQDVGDDRAAGQIAAADVGEARRPLRRALARPCRRGARGRGRHPLAALLRPGPGSESTTHHQRKEGNREEPPRALCWHRGNRPARRRRRRIGRGLEERHRGKATARDTGVSGTVTFDGIWTGSEATDFGKVIAAFNKVYPNVQVKYNPLGNNETTVLSTAITGGNPPDMADIAAPGT